jgi:DNA primase
MRPLPSTARPDSSSEVSSEAGDIAEAFTGKDYYQELINRANTVPLVKVLRHYGVRIDEHNRKVTCPFKSHSGGRERTASFWYYPDTNTYHCFGCKVGNRPVDFVAEMDHLTRVQAAHKVLELFESDVDEDNIYDRKSFSERLEIMTEFSTAVRDFYQTYSTEKARVYVEAVCKKFDTLNLKMKLNNEALARVVEEFKRYISLYKE